MHTWPDKLYCIRREIPFVDEYTYEADSAAYENKENVLYIKQSVFVEMVAKNYSDSIERERKLIEAAYLEAANQYWEGIVTMEQVKQRCVMQSIYNRANVSYK